MRKLFIVDQKALVLNSNYIIKFENVTFTYPTRTEPAIINCSFTVKKGDCVLVTGPTGCGKSTLLKMLNGIIPHLSKGKLSGNVQIAGLDSSRVKLETLTKKAGLIFQNPDDQIISNSVEEEIAFGLENSGFADAEIRKRIEWACAQVCISDLRERDPNTLSGGQKQRLVIASQIALRPQILAFDEPLSSLDPKGARDVMDCISGLKRQGVTIVLVEHRIAFAAPYCTHVMIMNHGTPVCYQPLDEAFMGSYDIFRTHGLEIPDEVNICRYTGTQQLTFNENVLAEHVKKWRDNCLAGKKVTHKPDNPLTKSSAVCISVRNVTFGYNKSKPLLKDFSFTVHDRETVALMGINGSGKSTLFSLIAGLNKPDKGDVFIDGNDINSTGTKKRASLLGFLLQNPDLMLFCDTVYEELAFGPRHVNCRKTDISSAINETLELLNLVPQRDQPPFALSVGQRLRAALGAVLSLQPPILLLDEPTTGQNEENIKKLMRTLFNMSNIKTVLFCTHDLNIAIEYADRIVFMNNGRIVGDGTPLELLRKFDTLPETGIRKPLTTRLAQELELPENMYLPNQFNKVLRENSFVERKGVLQE